MKDLELSANESTNHCSCGDSHCATCHPDNAEPSQYCGPGAFYCPYRNGMTACFEPDFCKGCKYIYTKLEARLEGLIN